MQRLSRERPLALASYISFPRSTDVVNVLRLAICPHQIANCNLCCPGSPDSVKTPLSSPPGSPIYARVLIA